jgi:hypothetical protein
MIQQQLEDCLSRSSSLFPMVVLPGMPSRALPIFQRAPLRWIAVPIVDIMDSHKRNLANRHHGEVLFVDAPSPNEMADYSAQKGGYWRQQQDDNLLLNLRDIKRRHARRIEADMKQYYLRRNNNNTPSSSKLDDNDPEMTPLRERGHLHLMSVDGIHPNDEGYEFWGRHIAQAIVQEWKQKQQQSAETPILE